MPTLQCPPCGCESFLREIGVTSGCAGRKYQLAVFAIPKLICQQFHKLQQSRGGHSMLNQVPLVAIQVEKHDHAAVWFATGFFKEFNATCAHRRIVSIKAGCVQE